MGKLNPAENRSKFDQNVDSVHPPEETDSDHNLHFRLTVATETADDEAECCLSNGVDLSGFEIVEHKGPL